MIEVGIMIEGQNGLNWNRWQKIARLVEDAGFTCLFRSDHFTNANPPDKASLELWTSLTWLASHTERIEFGPLVSPVSFRHPTLTARMAAAIDDLSGGRLVLGMGAGWQEREHTNFGWDLLDVPERFKRFEEGLEVVSRLLKSDKPVDFEGSYYRLKEAILLPRPERHHGPPILVGGNGKNRTLPLAARFANEWNSIYLPPDQFIELNGHFDRLLQDRGREPAEVKRSMMVGCEFGRDEKEVSGLVEKRTGGKRTAEDLRESIGMVVGTANQVVDQLGRMAEAGLQRVMLQWLALDDLDRLEAMASSVLPQVKE
jgi:F420-dependent oxidoreductase-like protein